MRDASLTKMGREFGVRVELSGTPHLQVHVT